MEPVTVLELAVITGILWFRRQELKVLGAEVKRRILLGTYALSAGYHDKYYLKALKVRDPCEKGL